MGEKLPEPWAVFGRYRPLGRALTGWCLTLWPVQRDAELRAKNLRRDEEVVSATVHRLCLASERDALQVRLDEALEVLREAEWVNRDGVPSNVCLWCYAIRAEGHADDCRLDAQLKKGGGDE